MKRILGIATMLAVLSLPVFAMAADQVGVYVAPKFVYGLTQMESIKGYYTDLVDPTESESKSFGSKTDDAFGGSIAVGYDFAPKFNVPLRAELEYAIFSDAKGKYHEVADNGTWDASNKQTIGIQTLFVNAYFDIDTGTIVTPYVGAGLGLGFISSKFSFYGYDINDPTDFESGSGSSKTTTNFAWNVGAGVGFDLTQNWTVDLGYRFVGLGSVKSGKYTEPGMEFHAKTKNLYQHQFALGVRYTF